MREEDRPTLPGDVPAAESATLSIHERDTLPVPPAPPLEDTPPMGMRLEELVAEVQRAIEREPTGAGAAEPEPGPPPATESEPSAETVAHRDAPSHVEGESLLAAPADESGPVAGARQEEIDTWRPPPMPAEPSVKPATAPVDGSSLAPRELGPRPAASAPGQRFGRGALATLAVVAVVAFVWSRGDDGDGAEHKAREPARSAAGSVEASARDVQRVHATPVAASPPPESLALEETNTPATPPLAEAAPAVAPQPPQQPAAPAITPARPARVEPVAPTQTAPVQVSLPEAPTRDEIANVLQTLHAEIAECAAGRAGIAELDLTILGSGQIVHVLVGGDFAGTEQGSCLARVLRAGRFAPFAKDKFRVLYRMPL